VYVDPSLLPWDEANLVMVNDLSDVLLDSGCWNTSFYILFSFKVSIEKSAMILMGLP
jgi:hypothetical protein